MGEIAIGNLSPGQVIAKDVYSQSGVVLANKGVKVTQRLVDHLINHNIEFVSVMDFFTWDIDIYDYLFEETMEIVNKIVPTLLRPNSKNPNTEDISIRVQDVLRVILKNKQVLDLLQRIRLLEDHSYQHSVKVSVFAIALGISLDLPKEQLDKLAIASLLHDIGKTKLPGLLLIKADSFNPRELETVRLHPQLGAKIILEESSLDKEIATVILEHHENFDGSGYPKGKVDEETNELAKIIHIADIFEALISERCYREKYEPREAIEYLLGAGGLYFNAELVEVFIENISVYRLGQMVRLNTGEVGIVVNVSNSISSRPIIALFGDNHGNIIKSGTHLDLGLKENTTKYITKIL